MKLTDMNEKEIMELNAFLAEHAMGLKRVGKIAAVQDGEFFVHKDNGVFVSVKGKMTRLECFKPTTDPAAAMAVLEKCCEKIGSYSIHIIGDSKHGYSVSESRTGISEHADALPIAICKFCRVLFDKSKARQLFSK